MPYKATETALERAQREFLRVIESAASANAPWQLKLVFDESDEDFIRKEVERSFTNRSCPMAATANARSLSASKNFRA
jgi:hypothetical protein